MSRHVVFESLEDRRVLSLSLAAIPTVSVPAGTAVCVALNGIDPGQTVSFSATGSNYSLLSPAVMPQTNKNVQINAEVNGASQSMTFQLFDNLFPLNGSSPNATLSAIENLFASGTYTGKTFYRVALDSNNQPFVVQGGVDPTTQQTTFKDQFDPNLQFTGAGVLAMANSGPDSNTTEFFITDETTRALDYNYTIFGFQTTGQTVRQQIAAMPVNTTNDDRLNTPVTINSASFITDTQNGVLMLRAAPGTTGQLSVTVTASDGTNAPVQQTFTVNVVADTGLIAADPWASSVPVAPTVKFGNGQSSLLTAANNSSPQKGIALNLANLTAGDLVTVYANGNPIYSTTPSSSTASITTDGTKTLADGSYNITVTQTLLKKTVKLVDGRSEAANVPSLDSQPVTLTVSTTPPKISSVAPTTATVDQSYSYQVQATSIATPLSYSLVTSPANMSISNTGQVTWIPNSSQIGSQAVDLRVTDQDGLSSDQTFTIATAAASATQFLVSAPTSITAGTSFSFTVAAEDHNGNPVTGYTGMVHFTSTDAAAVLPSDTTLTDGVGSFSVTLNTAGSQTLTATDIASGSITGTSGTISVNPAAAVHFLVSGPSSATVGTAFTLTVTAEDQSGNTTTDYTGTVDFTSTDAAAALPSDAPLIDGVGTFSATLNTAGSQTLTATDTVDSTLSGTSSAIDVAGPGPQFTSTAPTTATVGTQYSYQVQATSTLPLTYSLVTSPSGMSISSSGLVTWLPTSSQTGAQAVDVRATDSAGDANDQTFTITVASATTTPQVSLAAGVTAAIRLKGGKIVVVDSTGNTLFTQNGSIDSLTILFADGGNDHVTVDFASGGVFSLPQGLYLGGTSSTSASTNSLTFLGTATTASQNPFALGFASGTEAVYAEGLYSYFYNLSNVSFVGSGNDNYDLIGSSIPVSVTDKTGFNTLDFSSTTTTGSGLTLDLSKADGTTAQPIGPWSGSTLTLAGTFAEVVGTSNGNDTLTGGNAPITIFHAGTGNCTLIGGSGNNVIVGGGGNNTIVGGKNTNLLIAGSGKSTITAKGKDNIIVGGTTNIDANDQALMAIVSHGSRKTMLAMAVQHSMAAVQSARGMLKTVKNHATVATFLTVTPNGASNTIIRGSGHNLVLGAGRFGTSLGSSGKLT
jgi:cyclophilin family peptidyl-prolyl cis-trans isomerase